MVSWVNEEGFYEPSDFSSYINHIILAPQGVVRRTDPRYQITKIRQYKIGDLQAIEQAKEVVLDYPTEYYFETAVNIPYKGRFLRVTGTVSTRRAWDACLPYYTDFRDSLHLLN